MRSKTELLVRTMLPIVAGAGCMITLLTGMTAIGELRNATPRVGDIVAFPGAREPAPDSDFRLTAQRPSQGGCILDVTVLLRSGGSFVVESQLVQGKSKFRVHWAGQRTASDSGDCGSSADLLLDARELRVLASSAGGYEMGTQADPMTIR